MRAWYSASRRSGRSDRRRISATPVTQTSSNDGRQLAPYGLWRAPAFRTEDGRAVTHGIGAERPRQSSRTARFEREAKAISSLNHPHICNLYDIGREHNTEYLVLELLEGETLAARIARGPLPVTQVLRFGIEIAPRDSLSRWSGWARSTSARIGACKSHSPRRRHSRSIAPPLEGSSCNHE
jgi:serine/threonine protein kinase